MKAATLTIALSLICNIAAMAEDQYIHLSATATVAGKEFSTPSATFKSGGSMTVSYPVEKSEIVVTTKAISTQGGLDYVISATIPSGDGASKTDIKTEGMTDTAKPITYSFVSGGKPYAISVTLSLSTADGTIDESKK